MVDVAAALHRPRGPSLPCATGEVSAPVASSRSDHAEASAVATSDDRFRPSARLEPATALATTEPCCYRCIGPVRVEAVTCVLLGRVGRALCVGGCSRSVLG